MIIENLIDNLILKRISMDNVEIIQQRHICAIIDENGKDFNLISVGYNLKYKVNCETYHAEEDALIKLEKIPFLKSKKISIIILRISRNSNKTEYKLSMSKPCSNCVCLISKYKVKNIYYSIDNGMVKDKLKNILNSEQHISKFRKHH